jgi:hypothetical protein
MCAVEGKFIIFEPETLSSPFQKYFQKARGLLSSWKLVLRDSLTKYGKLNNRGKSNFPEEACGEWDEAPPTVATLKKRFVRYPAF